MGTSESYAKVLALLGGGLLVLTGWLVLVVVAAAPSNEPVALASPGLTQLNMTSASATYYSDHLAQQLSLEGMRVITATEISSLIGFERQKQLLGCSDSSSNCIVELANALGVDGLITGSIGKFGPRYQINVKILAAADGKPLSVHSARVSGDEALLDELTRAAQKMAREVYAAMKRQHVPGPSSPNPSFSAVSTPSLTQESPHPSEGSVRRWSWLPAAVGVASAGAGIAFMLMAGRTYEQLDQASRASTGIGDALALKRRGETQQTLSFIFYGIGAAGVLAGGAMYVWGGSATSVAVVPLSSGGAIQVSGSLW